MRFACRGCACACDALMCIPCFQWLIRGLTMRQHGPFFFWFDGRSACRWWFERQLQATPEATQWLLQLMQWAAPAAWFVAHFRASDVRGEWETPLCQALGQHSGQRIDVAWYPAGYLPQRPTWIIFDQD